MREIIGAESRELTRYRAKREKQERQEEELFIRAPVTKLDKKIEKHMTKSRNGYVLLLLLSYFMDCGKQRIWLFYEDAVGMHLYRVSLLLNLPFFKIHTAQIKSQALKLIQ